MQNFILVIRIIISVLNCSEEYECWKTIDWKEVWWVGERHDMVS